MFLRGMLALIIAIIIILILWPVPAQKTHVYFNDAPHDRLEVIAHGGGLGLRPANTLPALDAAIAMGADVLEVDVQRTADGVLVLLHDDTLDRTTDLTGPIAQMSWAEVGKADAGANRLINNTDFSNQGIGVPRFKDALMRFPDKRWIAEIKPNTEEAAIAMCQTIIAAGMSKKVLVGSFHKKALTAFRAACPDVATSMHSGEVARFAIAAYFGVSRFINTPAIAMQVPMKSSGIRLAHPRVINAAKAQGVRVHFWTINDTEEMSELITLGADGIITDYPPKLVSVLSVQ